MYDITFSSWPGALFYDRNIGTPKPMHSSVGFRTYFEQQQQLAEPDISHQELISAFRYSGRTYKHFVLAI